MNGIYIELDCLLDTRVGTAHLMGSEWASKIAGDKEYFQRLDDKYDRWLVGFPQQAFETAYAQRTAEVLKVSHMTPMVDTLKKHFQENRLLETRPDVPNVNRLIVNTYPYMLSEPDKEEMAATFNDLFDLDNLELVSLLPDLITPFWLSRNAHTFIVYDFDLWLNIHHKALGQFPIPRVQAIMPYIEKTQHGLPPAHVIQMIRKDMRGVLEVSPHHLKEFSVTL